VPKVKDAFIRRCNVPCGEVEFRNLGFRGNTLHHRGEPRRNFQGCWDRLLVNQLLFRDLNEDMFNGWDAICQDGKTARTLPGQDESFFNLLSALFESN
jgi:hypothetical protein